MEEALFCSPERRPFDHKETHHFLKKIETEDCAEKSDYKDSENTYDLAKELCEESDHIKALEITEKTISDHGLKKSCSPHHQLQGDIFFSLARKADTTDIKCVYLFASVDAYSMSSLLCPDSVSSFYGCARSLIELGDQLGINSFYKKAESKARHGLSVKMLKPQESSDQFIEDDLKAELEDLINLATWKMNISEAMLVKINVANQMQGQCKVDTYVIDRLKNLWDKHVHEFLPRNCSRPKRVDKFLADMICCGNWEPVDTSRAVDLIKARIKGTVRTFKSTEIYEHVIPKGDEIVSWVLDCPAIDTNFVSQVAEGVHNLEIWLAVLRIVRSTARKEVSYYSKRDKLQTYDKMLGEAEALCDKEDKWRNVYQRRRYALTFRSVCERRVTQDNATKCCFLNVVRDVLQGAESPRFEVLQDREFMECISELSTTVQNDVIRRSMCRLRKWLNEKLVLIDSKILLNEWTYKRLLEFAKLSAIDNRLVVLPLVKMFLQNKLKSTIETHKRKITTADAGASAKRRSTQTRDGREFF
ncbi:hypothetical protein DY000_02029589 [Brassica cretica]|uniref:DUF629 domain-containing protein n=1 Tax=Brassica cretica TaxID=69181 RepID=A0ABQ7DMA0_BRACR|nr:hypothetical protein DY000_02029589 [Brassica cretica]